LNNISWILKTGKDDIVSSENIGLQAGESIIVTVEYDYAGYGNYLVNATAYSANMIDSEAIIVKALNLSKLAVLNSSQNRKVFEFRIRNQASSNFSNLNWSIDFGDSSSESNIETIVLVPNEEIFVIVEHDYATSGSYVVNASALALNGTLIDSGNISVIVD
jgi:hypothetical protein